MAHATKPDLSATVSARQAAFFLAVSPQMVRRMVRDGVLPGHLSGKRPVYRVDRRHLLEMVGLDDYPFEAIR